MNINSRTDFADEKIVHQETAANYTLVNKKRQGCKIAEVEILKKDNHLRKEVGNYISLEFPSLDDAPERKKVAELVKDYLNFIIKKRQIKLDRILFVGLGNKSMVADSLGPMVGEKLFITNHLYTFAPELTKGTSPLASICPGVMGQTGLETTQVIKAVADYLKPTLVLVVDALATKSIRRINKVIQITDTGISPGSGLGNNHQAINEKSLKVPVIAVGVATVVDASAIVNETLKMIDHFYPQHRQWDDDQLVEDILTTSGLNMIVTPKEIDEDITHLTEVLALAINSTFHRNFQRM